MRTSTKEEIQAAVAKLTRQGLVSVRSAPTVTVDTLVKRCYEEKRRAKRES